MAYYPSKAQNKGYVRVQVRFDVSKPLRRSKLVNLPSGEVTTILYDYESLQKRCYSCQRLTHEQDSCLLFIMKQKGLADSIEHKEIQSKKFEHKILKEAGPLFGVLNEDQVN